MVKNFTDLTGRVAVVIGGTSGIGRSLAVGLAEAGADVIASGRRQNLAEEVAAQISALGRQTLAQAVNIQDRVSIDALRDAVLAKFGHVDILLNAAGQTHRKPTKDVDEAAWNHVMDVNLTGILRSCQSFYDALVKSGHGRVINIASLSSFVALHEVAAYCASKAACLSLTKSLAIEWAKDGVNVNAICPGVFPTELNASLLNGTERGREFIAHTPMRRFGRTEELVGAAVLLASDSASFITGQSIAVDGGFLAAGVTT
jgi:NAD(P)-dependent dehydrogenase (short-subunit alcohol dehydrogenase family)